MAMVSKPPKVSMAKGIALFDMPNLNRFDILSISISISIFLESPYRYRYRYRYFSELPYRYRYFSKVSIYRQSIFHIDILTRRRSNKNVFYRCTRGRSNKMCFTGAKKCLFYHFFMECHSIQFTTISINVERGIVKILFKYRYFQDLLIDIDIDIDISQILLIDIDINIDIFQNHHIDIDIDIFQKCRYIDNRYVISIYRTGLLGDEKGLT